jgi:glyoxylase-like metal-dependent hydrolase (beta-lactamase superfamily II)
VFPPARSAARSWTGARIPCAGGSPELEDQLVLIDTGFGLRDVADPPSRLSKFFLFLLKPEFREEMTAIRQIQRLGYDPREVRNIVLTHLDFDHAGGLDDFPHATVHLLAAERRLAAQRRTLLDRMRYRPQQWSTQGHWRTYEYGMGEGWFGFESVRDLAGVPPEILMVPLIGHTFGHAGVAIRRADGWMLQAGDAYFYHQEMDAQPRCTPGLRFYQWMMEKDRHDRLGNQARLRRLCQEKRGEVRVFCAHDPYEFERLTGRPTHQPADGRLAAA